MKSKKKTTSRISVKLIAISLGVILILSVIAALFVLTYDAFQVAKSDDHKINHLLISSSENLSQPVPTDAKSGLVYIREEMLTLPPTNEPTLQFRYTHIPASEGQNQELHLVSAYNLRYLTNKIMASADFEDAWSYVPEMQSCSRGYAFFFKDTDQVEGEKVFEKQLNDGRTVHVYKDNGCRYNHTQMVDYLKQINSY